MRSLESSYPLPASLQGGIYTVSAELFDVVGAWIGAATGSFGVAVSRISVTPTLPQMFSTGNNSLLFNLNNVGDLPAASGRFTLALKDESGLVVAAMEQPFTLAPGTGKTVTVNLALPTLPFGAYSLVYSQSDETRDGVPVTIPLVNAVTITALFDNNSHRVRDTATLNVTVANTGRFALESGLPIAVTLPAAGYTETRSLVTVPVSGNTQVFSFTIPASLGSGEHIASITAALPGGPAITASAKLVIFPAALTLEPLPTNAAAGGAVSVHIVNSGGIDTQAACRLSLYDMTSKLIAEKVAMETALAGASLPIALSIPAGAVDGSYSLVVNYRNSSTGAEETVSGQLLITGVKGSLLVTTGKSNYLPTEPIAGQSSITTSGFPLQNGNLHLQVTNASGSRQQRIWTSQFDFQQGVRSGLDAYSVPGAVSLLSLSDNFDDGILNTDRWTKITGNAGMPPAEESGFLKTELPGAATAGNVSALRAAYLFSGDFDISVDYSITKWSSQSHMGIITYIDGNELRWGVFANKSFETMWAYYDWRAGFTAPDNGKLRLKRSGNMYYCYFWNESAWTLFTVYRLPAPAVTVQFWANSDTQGNPMEIHWDNFTSDTNFISAGTMNLKYDSGQSDYWDKFAFDGDIPTGTGIKFRTRTAETEAGLASGMWSDYITTSGSPITNPKGRWIEVETTMSTTDTTKTPVLRDISVTQGHNPGEIFWQTDIPVNLDAGATTAPASSIDTLAQPGKYYLQGTLTADTGQTTATAEYPFYVVQGNMLLTLSPDKKLYKPGETVTINGTISNMATIEAANLVFSVKAKAGTGAEQALIADTFSIPVGSSRTFKTTTTAGTDGVVALMATIAQNGTTLAAVADQYEISSPKVAATLSGPDNAGTEPITLTLTLANSGKTDALITVTKSFNSPPETLTISAGQTRLLQYPQQLTADSNYAFTLSGDLALQLTKTVVYLAPKQAAKVSVKAVTDKISYNAIEKVAITTTINCLNAGTTGDTLKATVMIVNSGGEELFTDQFILSAPDTGRIYTDSRYWNSAAYPPGVYVARVTVESGGAVLATSEATFTVLSSSVSGAGVAGAVSPAMNAVYLGIDESLAITVKSSGNEDLAAALLAVTVINPDTQAIMQSYSKMITLPRQGTFTDTVIVPTAAFAARDYLAILQITLPGMAQAKTIAGTPFSVKIAPPPTLLISTLSDGAVTNNQTLNITGSATGVVAIRSLTINTTDVPLNSDGSFSHALLLQTGDYVVSTIVTDILGHTATDSRTITLDQLAPTLTIDSPADNSTTAVSPIEVKGRVDETSTVTVTVKESGQTLIMNGKDFSATVLPLPRWNTIEITATDLAGNTSSQKRSVLFDDQKPSLAITAPDQDIRTNKSSLTLSGKASDPYTAVGVTVAMDGSVLAPAVIDGIFSQIVNFTDEKLYPITVTASNEVGTQTTVQRNVIFDKTPPNLTIDPVVTPTNGSAQTISGTRENGIAVTVSCATATVGAVEYPAGTTWRAAISGLAQGENRLLAEAYDLAGNKTTAVATILYVPKTPDVFISASRQTLWPPNKKLVPVVISGNVATFGSDIKDVTISVADEYGKYNLQGLKFGDTVLLEAWREGSDMDGRVYTITAVVTDQAGNRATKSATVIVPHDMGK